MREMVFVGIVFSVMMALGGCAKASKKSSTPPAGAAATATSEEGAKKEAAKGTGSQGDLITCRLGADQRKIEVRPQGGGCELAYTKMGEESVIATSQAGKAHCQTVQERVKNNLINAGFTCK